MTPPLLESANGAPRIAFQGELGAFSEEVVAALWPDAEPVPMHGVADVTRAVSAGDTDAGVVPLENTVAGGVVAAYDALAGASALYAIAEAILEIRQCLLAVPGATLGGIEVVESHPVALAQCSSFLTALPHARQRAVYDTAGAARDIAGAGDPRRAAIASRKAAVRYGLAVLADHIADRADNQTRFLAVARNPVRVEPGTLARTSLVFTTANEPGALLRALEPVTRNQLNLSKIEPRPTGEPWAYRFFADIDHMAGDPRLDTTLETVAEVTATCRILGTYARALA